MGIGQRYLVALGSNLPSAVGSPTETVVSALAALAASGVAFRAVSRFYRTPAFPPGSGPDFVNAACVIRHSGSAAELLEILHGVEADLGRERGQRWAARVVDLDLLGGGDLVIPDAETVQHWIDLPPEQQATRQPDRLILPHPRIQDRAFVLLPLADIVPDWQNPVIGSTVRQMLDALPEEAFEGIAVL